MIAQIAVGLIMGVVGWAYWAIKPPRPKICGTPGGPPVTSPRIKLSDGRHLAYREAGVPKEEARYKIIVSHGFNSHKDHDMSITQEVLEELRVYLLYFDRAGYGESDPNPKRFVKSEALDVEELADKLQLGPKFYFIGMSYGGIVAWSCLKYIPHRVLGVCLLSPHVNYYWTCFPANLVKQGFKRLPVQDQWAFRVAHYFPWLFNWWVTQKWFPTLSIEESHFKNIFTDDDLEILSKTHNTRPEKIHQQGRNVSMHRDILAGYGKWEFDPTDIANPFPNNEGSVYLCQGFEDKIIPRQLNHYISEKLPWIKYHEVPDGGHVFFLDYNRFEGIFRKFLLG